MTLNPNVALEVKNKIKSMESQLVQWEKDLVNMEKARIPTLALREQFNTTKAKVAALKSVYG